MAPLTRSRLPKLKELRDITLNLGRVGYAVCSEDLLHDATCLNFLQNSKDLRLRVV